MIALRLLRKQREPLWSFCTVKQHRLWQLRRDAALSASPVGARADPTEFAA